MINTDMQKFIGMLTGIADYYGRNLREETILLYWEGLKQYDYSAVEKAFWTHTQNPDSGQFMPKIADVAKYLKGRTTDQASQAWSKVDKAMRHVGTYQDVCFDDAIIHRVIEDMGGWILLGMKTQEDWTFLQNQFENRYRGYVMRDEKPEYQARLIGIGNAHNAQNGFTLNPPMMIGDQLKALMVLKGGSNKALLEMKPAFESIKLLQ
jgi:hypothetical protein